MDNNIEFVEIILENERKTHLIYKLIKFDYNDNLKKELMLNFLILMDILPSKFDAKDEIVNLNCNYLRNIYKNYKKKFDEYINTKNSQEIDDSIKNVNYKLFKIGMYLYNIVERTKSMNGISIIFYNNKNEDDSSYVNQIVERGSDLNDDDNDAEYETVEIPEDSYEVNDSTKKQVLIIGVQPPKEENLSIAEEMKNIYKALMPTNNYEIHSHFVITRDLFEKAINTIKPDIIHFIGHGNDKGIILLSRSEGKSIYFAEDLNNFLLTNIPELLYLNCCYSYEVVSKFELNKYNSIICNSKGQNDTLALYFASWFYVAYSKYNNYDKAYNSAFKTLEFDLKKYGVLVERVTNNRIDDPIGCDFEYEKSKTSKNLMPYVDRLKYINEK